MSSISSLQILDLTDVVSGESIHPDWTVRFNPSIAKIQGEYFLMSYRIFYSQRYTHTKSWAYTLNSIEKARENKVTVQKLWDRFLEDFEESNVLTSFIQYSNSSDYKADAEKYVLSVANDPFTGVMKRIFEAQPSLVSNPTVLRGPKSSLGKPKFSQYSLDQAVNFWVNRIRSNRARREWTSAYEKALRAYVNFRSQLESLGLDSTALEFASYFALYPEPTDFTLDLLSGFKTDRPRTDMERYNDEIERSGHLPLFHPSRTGWYFGASSARLTILAITKDARSDSYHARAVKDFPLEGLEDVRIIRDYEDFELTDNEFAFVVSGDNKTYNEKGMAAKKIILRFPKMLPLSPAQEANIIMTDRYVTKTGRICNNVEPHGRNWTPFWLNRDLYFNYTFLPHRVLKVMRESQVRPLPTPDVTSEDTTQGFEKQFRTIFNFDQCSFVDAPSTKIPKFFAFQPENYRFSLGTPALLWSKTEFIAVGHSRFNSRLRVDLPKSWQNRKPSLSPATTKNYERLLTEFIKPQETKIEENAAFYYYFCFFFTYDSRSMAITSMSHSFLFESHMPFLVEFPVGLEHGFPHSDPRQDMWIISYGEGDSRIKLAFMSREDIASLLVPIEDMLTNEEFHNFILLSRKSARKENVLMTPTSYCPCTVLI